MLGWISRRDRRASKISFPFWTNRAQEIAGHTGRAGTNILLPPQRKIQQRPASSRQEGQDSLKVKKVRVVAEFFHFFQ